MDRAIVNAADLAQMAAETDAKQSFAEQLGLWLDWTGAIALSAVLNGHEFAQPLASQTDQLGELGTPQPAVALMAELKRVRHDLAQAIKTADAADADALHADNAADFLPYRRSYRAHQQAMETRIGVLRAQARVVLSGLSADLKRIAALDAVLDKALAAKERHVLSTLPSLLEKHFKRLGANGAQGAQRAPAPAWLAVFCSDMQATLLAELDLRVHAVEGMVEAMPNLSTRQ